MLYVRLKIRFKAGELLRGEEAENGFSHLRVQRFSFASVPPQKLRKTPSGRSAGVRFPCLLPPFLRVFSLFQLCKSLVYSAQKFFSKKLSACVAGKDKRCIFAVPFCAPDERRERERMRPSERIGGEGKTGKFFE